MNQFSTASSRRSIYEINRVPMDVAAKELGMSGDQVRVMMIRQHRGMINNFDIGAVMPSRTGKKNNYYIYRDKLDAFLGKSK